MSRLKAALLTGAAAAIALATLSVPAQAADVSYVLANPDPVTVAYGGSTSVVAALDAACAQALSTGKTYAINAVMTNTAVATVAQAQSGAIQCPNDNGNGGGKKSGATDATFGIAAAPTACSTTGDGNVSTTLTLSAVVGPHGLQNKIGDPTEVPVTVTGAPACVIDPGPDPDPGKNPAAPAVANTYLNADSGAEVVGLCKQKYGKSWRGTVISAVAAAMPKPESQKDDYTFTEWTTRWRDFVDAFCAPTTPTPTT